MITDADHHQVDVGHADDRKDRVDGEEQVQPDDDGHDLAELSPRPHLVPDALGSSGAAP